MELFYRMNMKYDSVIQGDCLKVLKAFPDGIIDCCVTSPPYYGLRDYGCEGQIGLEKTPEEYVDKLVAVFHEVKRILRDDGTLWLNIGDSYWGSGSRGYDFTGKWTEASKVQCNSKGTENLSNIPKLVGTTDTGIKNKDLVGIPWMLAFALRSDGWYLRQDIIWQKPNPMPESVKDRCTKSHEYIFLLSKKPHYYFDSESIQEDAKSESKVIYKYGFNNGKEQEHIRPNGASNTAGMNKYTEKRNKRDVWNIVVKPVRDAHFATYPEELVTPCILAGCRCGGVVLDPFFGSGTTGRVAISLNRHYLGIELNPEYIGISNKRTNNIQLTFTGLI